MADEDYEPKRSGGGCLSALGWTLVVALLGVLGWLIAAIGLPFGLGHGLPLSPQIRQAALDLGSQVGESARSVLPLGEGASRSAPASGPHPHIVPTGGKAVHPQAISFTFDGVKHSITAHVASGVYYGAKSSTRFLVQLPGESDAEWTRAYYRDFADDPAQSPAIDDVCEQLRAIRSSSGLTSDQYLELVAKYVQSIPYDWKLFEAGNGQQRFPVQTLVDGRGLCGDKSVLLADLLAHEGYRVALLDFDPEKHMAVGVSGPGTKYEGSGFLFLETTAPCYVTDVPPAYAGGMTLRSDPIVIAIGSGTKTYTAADELARIMRVRDSAQQAAEALYRKAKGENLSADQARAVNRKLNTAYEATTSLRSNVVDESGKSVGKFMDRTQAVRWIDRNAWWL